MGRKGIVFRVSGIDLTQFPPEEVQAYFANITAVLAGGAQDLRHIRVISRTVPMDLSAPIEQARLAAVQQSAPRHAAVVNDYVAALSKVQQQSPSANEHYLIVWANKRMTAPLAQTLGNALGMQVSPQPDLPPILPGRYRDAWGVLEPVGHHGPYFVALVSYDLVGIWDWTVMPSLLASADYPIAVSVDIVTLPRQEALSTVMKARNKIAASMEEVGVADAELEGLIKSLQQALSAIHAGETLHLVTVGVLVPGATRKQAAGRARTLRSAMSQYAHLFPHKPQGRLIREMFTAEERGSFSPTLKKLRRNTISTGAAIALGVLGVRRRGDTNGVLWGFADDGSPIFWDGFGDLNNPDPNHGIVLGATGQGKTFALHMIALREILIRGTQVIEMEPMGHSRRLKEALGDRATYNPIDLSRASINPLDVVYDSLPNQVAHAIVQVSLLLQRRLDNFERGVLDEALRDIYNTISPDDPPEIAPRLENLVVALDGIGGAVARNLSEEIRRLFVEGTPAAFFNQPTTIDLRLRSDAILFDFSNVSEAYRTLLYAQVLAAINRHCLREGRRKRRRIIVVDEFRILSREPMLASTIAQFFKSFRTTGTGVWVAEQNPLTLVGLEDGSAVSDLDLVSGRYIWENATWVMALGMPYKGAESLRRAIPSLTDHHIQVITSANVARDKGRGIVKFPDGIYPMRIVPTMSEIRLLGGT